MTDGETQGARERGAMAGRAGLVATGTLASRVLGAVRDSVIAHHFALGATDAFYVSFTIPNALRGLLGEGAVGGAFIPVYAEVRQREGEPRARAFYAGLTGVMLAILALVSIGGVLFAGPIVKLYAAGYDARKYALTVTLTQLVFPYIFFMGVAALGMGVLNALRRFFVPAFAPAMLSVAMIAAPVAFVPLAIALGLDPITGLALAALVGGALQVGAQIPASASRSALPFEPRPRTQA